MPRAGEMSEIPLIKQFVPRDSLIEPDRIGNAFRGNSEGFGDEWDLVYGTTVFEFIQNAFPFCIELDLGIVGVTDPFACSIEAYRGLSV